MLKIVYINDILFFCFLTGLKKKKRPYQAYQFTEYSYGCGWLANSLTNGLKIVLWNFNFSKLYHLDFKNHLYSITHCDWNHSFKIYHYGDYCNLLSSKTAIFFFFFFFSFIIFLDTESTKILSLIWSFIQLNFISNF